MRRAWLLAMLLLAGCSQTMPPDEPEYGAVLFEVAELDTAMAELPTDITWVNSTPGPFIWGDIQIEPDQSVEQWSWQQTDSIIQAAEAHDVNVVVTLWPYALWDQAQCHGDWPNLITLFGAQFGAPYPPCDQSSYQTWVKAVVQRYGDTVTTWQVMRLPEQQAAPLATFVGSSQTYYTIAQLTAEAIRSVQPDAQIVSGMIGQPTSDTIAFWGPLLEQESENAIFNILGVAVTDDSEWQVLKTWLERYHLTLPVWIMQTVVPHQFDGAAKVFYTVSND